MLSWIVSGALAYRESGLAVPASVELETAAYREGEDELAAWLEECCELGGEAFTLSRSLLASFDSWARATGSAPLTRQTFAERLKGRADVLGIESGKDHRGWRGWRGIALRDGDRQEQLPGSSSATRAPRGVQWEPGE